jgi:hypothetical protein
VLPDLPWFVYAMLLAPLGLLLAVAVYKSLQVRAAREWPSAAGKVVVSKAEVRKVKVIDSDRAEGHRFEERNFADIVYEYSVAGRKLRTEFVTTRIPQQGNAAAAVAFGAFGTVIALFALILHRQASLAMKWPVVTGTIKLSDIEQYRAARQDDGSGTRVMYQRRVSYTYQYNNITYTNAHATLASSVASTSSWLVRKSTTDYKDGASVKVWVNPDNPSQATLEPRAGFVWVLWLAAAAILGVAYYAAVHG